ncbi:hypothetical protein Tco_1228278 [Tanacetum coccineum]
MGKTFKDLLHLRNPTAQDMEILVKTCLMPLALKTQNDSFAFVHELKQEMHADLNDGVESLKMNLELNLISAEFTTCMICFCKNVCLKDSMECDCLAQKTSEQTEFVVKRFTLTFYRVLLIRKTLISLDIAYKTVQGTTDNDYSLPKKRRQIKLILVTKGKSVETQFDKPSVVRQPNAQRIPKPSVLGKPAPFSDSLERKYFAKKKSVLKTNESEGLSKPVTPQNLPQTAKQAVRNTNVIKPGMYRIASSTTQTRAPQLNQTSRNTNPRVFYIYRSSLQTNVSRPPS